MLGTAEATGPVVAGDAPTLGYAWQGTSELTRIGGLLFEVSQTPESLRVQMNDDTAYVTDAIHSPGVYRATSARSGERLLAVNVDPDAGDTYAAQPRVEQYFDKLGGWSYLQDKRQAGGVLALDQDRADLTQLLLWFLLGLVLIETVLARAFSHATDHDMPTVMGRVAGALHGGPQRPGRAA